MQEYNALRPYLIATAILVLCLYCGLIVWIAFRPSEVLDPDVKTSWLLFLIVLPGRFVAEWVSKKANLSIRSQSRLSFMALSGLLIGLHHATNASGIMSSLATFVVAFVLASIAYLALDFSVDWLWSRWKRR